MSSDKNLSDGINDEDRTFLLLKRLPFDDLRSMINSMPAEFFLSIKNDEAARDNFLFGHGWTFNEFLDEVKNMKPI